MNLSEKQLSSAFFPDSSRLTTLLGSSSTGNQCGPISSMNAAKTPEYALSAPFRCAVVKWWAQKLKPNVETTNAAEATREITKILRTSDHFFVRRNRTT